MLASGTRLGSYEILSALGAGGMGEVYQARDTRLRRRVAIKVIPADRADPEMIRRFEDEALSASALNHPNILTVHEYGAEQGVHFLVTELIEGESLRQALSKGALPIGRALSIAIEVASALDAAHGAGIVHRDIKPENIMLRPDGYAKVLDFGLAKMTPHSPAASQSDTMSLRTVPGMILGTIGYMPPEQVRGMPVDARADIWSVGVVLHEMLTGVSPFQGPTTSDVIAAVLEREPPSLASRGVAARPELERIIAKTLAKDPDARYQTIRDLLIDLKRLREEAASPQASTVVDAHTAGWKHRVIAASLAMLVVVGALFGWRAPVVRMWRGQPSATPAEAGARPSVNPGPFRTVTYWLTVQRMRAGHPYQAPFESAGLEIFDTGDKFSLHVQSPDRGYVYLLNQGPAKNGRETLAVLYPSTAVQQVGVNQIVQTGWYYFDPNIGIEQFWLVWSTEPVSELSSAYRWVNPDDQGLVKNADEASAIERFLESHVADQVTVAKDRRTRRTSVTGRGNVIVQTIELEHR